MRAMRLLALGGIVLVSSALGASNAHAAILSQPASGASVTPSNAQALVLSPDGAQLYVAGSGSGANGAVYVFTRDATAGGLTLASTAATGGGNGCAANQLKNPTSIAVSADGKTVYVAAKGNGAGGTLTAFSRALDGSLSCIQSISEKSRLKAGTALSVSDDGGTVYLGYNAGKSTGVQVYSRNTTSGTLTYLATYNDGTAAGGTLLSAPTSTAVTPLSGQVLVTSSNDSGLTVFTRQSSGSLPSFTAIPDGGAVDGLAGARGLAISADGRSVYVAGFNEVPAKIATFARDPSTGVLTFVNVQANTAPVANLGGISGLAVSPDGGWLFGASSTAGALVLFGRDPATSKLTFAASQTGITAATAVAVNKRSSDNADEKTCAYVLQPGTGVQVWCLGAQDFGDAPDATVDAAAHFRTLAADGGARSAVDSPALFLGASVDTERTGVPTVNADGDDTAGVPNDEDGVTTRNTNDDADVPLNDPTARKITGGAPYTVKVTVGGTNTGATARLDAWIDYDHDGDFDDTAVGSDERVIVDQPVTIGSTTSIQFTPPALIFDGTSYMRFRLRDDNTAGGQPSGGGGIGEVEDYKVTLNSNSAAVNVATSGSGRGSVTSSPVGFPSAIACGSPGSTGTCSTLYPANDGTNVTLTETHDACTTFGGFTGDPECTTANSTCTFTNISANKSVTAAFTLLTDVLTVSVTGSGGQVDATVGGVASGVNACREGGAAANCSATYDCGTAVLLTPTADANWTFTGWSGADVPASCTGGAALDPCVVTVDQAKSISATFKQSVSKVTISVSGSGGGTITSSPPDLNNNTMSCTAGQTCSVVFNNSDNVTVTLHPTADPDSFFTPGWSGDCPGTGTATGDCVFPSLAADKNGDAEFTIGYTLTVNRTGNGSGSVSSDVSHPGISCGVDCSELYVDGTQVTLTATPDVSSSFTGWSGGGCSGTGTCTVTMSAATTVTANFALKQWPLTISFGGTGSGSVTSSPSGISCPGTCSFSFDDGAPVTLTATPSANSTLTGWSGDCTPQLDGTCIATLHAAGAVTALFALKPPDLAVAVADASATVPVPAGGTVTVTVTVTNPGPVDVTGASLTTAIVEAANITGVTWTCAATGSALCASPSGSGNLSAQPITLAAGGDQIVYTLTGTAPTPANGTGGVTTTATLTVTGDSDPSNNSASAITQYAGFSFRNGFESTDTEVWESFYP